jgi:2',3'-cyclic-nucleotide 2'-phosphodiesterase (5'-nucleotidase family)
MNMSGVRITFDPDLDAGNRILYVQLTDGGPLADEGSYTIAVGNFFAEGGGGYTILRDLPREDMGMKSIDALVAYLQGAPQPFAIPRSRRVVSLN